MVGSGEGQEGAHDRHQCPPKLARPAWVPVRNYQLRHSKVPYDPVKEEMSRLHGPQLAVAHPARCEAHQLGQPVNAGEDSVKAIHQGKVGDKVNAPAAEPLLWNLQGLQQTGRRGRTVLDALANRTTCNELLYIPV